MTCKFSCYLSSSSCDGGDLFLLVIASLLLGTVQ